MKSTIRLALIIAVSACAPTTALLAKTPPAGMRYADGGKVAFHRGQPCTSQIMYDFHPNKSKSVIWLAAGEHESRKLTEAADKHRRVRITGTWKRGRDNGCGYVDVSNVTIELSFFDKLFKP